MSSIVLNETQLKRKMTKIYTEEYLGVLEEKWNKLNDEDKVFVVEMLKVIYPEKSKLIKESKWYNLIGDIVGIFDPTGIVDLINGISYWRQGDKLFALLSWISVFPYVGDAVAKPIVGLFKMGGSSAKAFKAASIAGDTAKMAKIAKEGGPLKGLLTKVSSWAPKILDALKSLIGRVPFVGKGFVRAVDDYIKLFKDAGSAMGKSEARAIQLTGKRVAGSLTRAEAIELKQLLKRTGTFRGFRDFKGKGGLAAGVPRLWGNRGTRGLMRKTRWYARLLDYLGIANFVGPNELETQVPNLNSKINEFNQTDDAVNAWNQDVDDINNTGGETQFAGSTTTKKDQSLLKKATGKDPIDMLIGSLFS
jgi:hypothetical protein